jgi:exonuclease VII small subunit
MFLRQQQGRQAMSNLTPIERRNYEQRLARLEDTALRLSGELFIEGATAHAAKRLHHNLEAVETEIELICEALSKDDSAAA